MNETYLEWRGAQLDVLDAGARGAAVVLEDVVLEHIVPARLQVDEFGAARLFGWQRLVDRLEGGPPADAEKRE